MNTNYKIKELITRGDGKLRCEDEIFHTQYNNFSICALFDGCSSGKDSHYASTHHKLLLKDAIENEILWENVEDISRGILNFIYEELYNLPYERGVEMLSTIILLIVNEVTEEYFIVFAGDGVTSIDGKVINVHDANGDSVWYLSNVYNPYDINCLGFNEAFSNYYTSLKKISGKGFNTISISTDGIDTFKNKYGTVLKEEAREFFFNNDKFDNLDNQLKRLYNIFIKGLNIDDKIPCINIDDFSMIKINKIIE